MYQVILLEPESPGNIGAVARIIENFEIDEFFVVNPQCAVRDSEEAKTHAVNAQETLRSARIVDTLEQAADTVDYLVGTTGVDTTDENVLRTPVTPREMMEDVPDDARIGLLFGREGKGLRNSELAECDFVVTIPTSTDYPVMNLSHAVAVVCYECFVQRPGNGDSGGERDATSSSKPERTVLENLFKDITDNLDWEQDRQEKTVRAFTNIMGRAYVTDRELSLLLGLFRETRDSIIEVKNQEDNRG